MSGPSASSDTGLPSNVGAGICAFFTPLGGIIFYFIEKKDSLVRHWAVQSIYFGVSIFVFFIVLSLFIGILSAIISHIPVINIIWGIMVTLLYPLLSLAIFIIWILGLIKAFTGERWEYPFLTPIWKKWFPNLTA
jgi:uncharacterized membrane protein